MDVRRILWSILLFLLACGVSAQQQDSLFNDTTRRDRIQVALLLDVSNSMDGLINQARSQLWKMVNELATAQKDSLEPLIEIALYEYGKSRLEASKGFVRQVTPLTTDLDQVSKSLFDLRVTGALEYCGWAIKSATEELAWSKRPGDLKIIIIAGNEAFYQGQVPFRRACETARQKDIIINTIFCGSYKKGIRELWKEGADIGGGKYMSINQEEKVYHFDTPYDEQIMAFNEKLNATYLPYGPKGQENFKRLVVQDQNAASFGNANMRTRIVVKTKPAYYNGSWDLVDRWNLDRSILNQIASVDLPMLMQPLTRAQREAYIKEMSEERMAVKKQINELAGLAKAHIKSLKTQSVDGPTLDVVLLELVRLQAQEKDFVFSDKE